MLACTASMVVTTIVIGVLLWAILTISRDTVPFGVSVPTDRIHHPVVLRATRLWHRICATVTIAAIALLIWFHLREVGARRPGLPSLVVVVQIRAALACWVLVRLPIIRAKRAADWYARLRTLLAEARAHGMSEQNVRRPPARRSPPSAASADGRSPRYDAEPNRPRPARERRMSEDRGGEKTDRRSHRAATGERR